MNLKIAFMVCTFFILAIERTSSESNQSSHIPKYLKKSSVITHDSLQKMIAFRNYLNKQTFSFKNDILHDLDSVLAKVIREGIKSQKKKPTEYLCDHYICWMINKN